MNDTLTDRATPEADAGDRSPSVRRSAAAFVVVAALLGAFGLGLAIADARASADAAGSTDLTTATDEAAASASGPWLDAEFDFLGAVATWPSAPDATTVDPFRTASDASLVAAGRTVCTHAGDDGMDADGMGDLLDTTPHQTYVLTTEAIDKLCPSQRSSLSALRS